MCWGNGVLYNAHKASELEDAWQIIKSQQTFCLKGVSGQAHQKIQSFLDNLLCVRSSFVKVDKEAQKRSTRKLDITTGERSAQAGCSIGSACADTPTSITVQLQVKNDDGIKLIVKPKGNPAAEFEKLGLTGRLQKQYELVVDYADDICFLISYATPRGSPSMVCALWVRQDYQEKPPKCCVFIYYQKCTFYRQVQAYDEKVCPAISSENSSR